MAVTKKQCKKGYGCGRTCISRTRNCHSNLDADGIKISENYTQFALRIAGESLQGAIDDLPTSSLVKLEATAVKPEPKPQPVVAKPEPKPEPLPVKPEPKPTVTKTDGNFGLEIEVSINRLINNAHTVDLRRIDRGEADAAITELADRAMKKYGDIFKGLSDIRQKIIDLSLEEEGLEASVGMWRTRQEAEVAKTKIFNEKTKLEKESNRLQGVLLKRLEEGRNFISRQEAEDNVSKFVSLSERGLRRAAQIDRLLNGFPSKVINEVEIKHDDKFSGSAVLRQKKVILGDSRNTKTLVHEMFHFVEEGFVEMQAFALNYLISRSYEEDFNNRSARELEGFDNAETYRDFIMIGDYAKPYQGLLQQVRPTNQASLGFIDFRPTEIVSVFSEILESGLYLKTYNGRDQEGLAAFVGVLDHIIERRSREVHG